MRLELDPVAWQKVFEAGEHGRRRCPYPATGTASWSWSSSWIEGDAKRRGYKFQHGGHWGLPHRP